MNDQKAPSHRAAWFDIPVMDLEQAASFYRAVLAIPLHRERSAGVVHYVLEPSGGNGGCLVQSEVPIRAGGVLVYLNVDGRIRDAVLRTQQCGGRIIEPVRAIAPHGFRAIVLDCEGNRIALHSRSDA